MNIVIGSRLGRAWGENNSAKPFHVTQSRLGTLVFEASFRALPGFDDDLVELEMIKSRLSFQKGRRVKAEKESDSSIIRRGILNYHELGI